MDYCTDNTFYVDLEVAHEEIKKRSGTYWTALQLDMRHRLPFSPDAIEAKKLLRKARILTFKPFRMP
jgi:hypothetical protein